MDATQENQKQYIKCIGYTGYGAERGWRVALVAPDGEVVQMQGLGYDGQDQASSYVMFDVIAALKASNINGVKLVLMSPHQMLNNENLMQWHSIRLAWGSANPDEEFASCPDGSSLDWHLYWCANGVQNEFASGSLPADWWEIDPEERNHRIEQRHWEDQ